MGRNARYPGAVTSDDVKKRSVSGRPQKRMGQAVVGCCFWVVA